MLYNYIKLQDKTRDTIQQETMKQNYAYRNVQMEDAMKVEIYHKITKVQV